MIYHKFFVILKAIRERFFGWIATSKIHFSKIEGRLRKNEWKIVTSRRVIKNKEIWQKNMDEKEKQK